MLFTRTSIFVKQSTIVASSPLVDSAADDRIVFSGNDSRPRQSRTQITDQHLSLAVPAHVSDCRRWSVWVVYVSSSSLSLMAAAAVVVSWCRSVAHRGQPGVVHSSTSSRLRVPTTYVLSRRLSGRSSSNADRMVPCRQCTRSPVCPSITQRRPVCLSTNGRVLHSQVITSAADQRPAACCTTNFSFLPFERAATGIQAVAVNCPTITINCCAFMGIYFDRFKRFISIISYYKPLTILSTHKLQSVTASQLCKYPFIIFWHFFTPQQEYIDHKISVKSMIQEYDAIQNHQATTPVTDMKSQITKF